MNKFETGDRVRRIKGCHNKMKPGDVGTVENLRGLRIKEFPGTGAHDPTNFILVKEAPPKPWLRVTPPQPEKRELVEFWPNSETHVNFRKAANGRDLISICMGAIHKETLDELIETLKEISREMK